MYNKITVYGDLNIDYMWAKSSIDEEVSPDLEKPIWDTETIALANFNSDSSASSYDGANFEFDKYKIFRINDGENKLKYIATVNNNVAKIKDYTNPCGNNSRYLIYPINKQGKMGTVIETKDILPEYDYWTISEVKATDEKNVYTIDSDATWKFWLSPEISSFAQVTNKSVKTGFGKYPKIKHSNVNYTMGTMSFYLGDLKNCGVDYSEDTIERKNRWIEFANSPTPKILTDTKGECMFLDITPKETKTDYKLSKMPTTITFDFIQLESIENITAYSEVED